VLGGTFDPPHIGHTVIARVAAERLGLGKVLFVPTETPPHKPARRLAPVEDRIEMLHLAVDEFPFIEISLVETGSGGPFYTVDTLEKISGKAGVDAELFLVVGEDNLHDLFSWKNPARIAELARITVLTRNRPDGITWLPVPSEIAGGCLRLTMEPVPISSTQIRGRIARGGPIEGLVEPAVRDYIELKGLYKDG